uniref:DUF1275 domain protein n=1 Tax=Mycena chlorophos TaxID=658473 RepID=A0ABQ0MB43_MYCCL|nr:predicted protein [Mycena chlorophos]
MSRTYWHRELDFTRTNPKRAQHLPFLLLLSFAAGAIDVFSVPFLGVFTANNTGNIVFLAMAASQLAPIDPADTNAVAAITSLTASWAGTATSGQIGNLLSARRKRYWVFVDMVVQSIVVFIVVGLIWGGHVHPKDKRTEYVAVALLSFSMGAQNVTTKGMNGPPTMPTQVATGAMADFFSDPKLFARKNTPRDERIVFIFVFFVGGLVGGLCYRYYAPQLCLLLTAIFKLFAGLSLLFLRVNDPEEPLPPKANGVPTANGFPKAELKV